MNWQNALADSFFLLRKHGRSSLAGAMRIARMLGYSFSDAEARQFMRDFSA